MYINQPSIEVAQSRARNFRPPYCANSTCLWHFPEKVDVTSPFQRFGSAKIKRFPYISPRFRCLKCRKTFSASFFGLQFRDQKPNLYAEIQFLLTRGLSGRAIALHLGWDEDTIRRKKKRLARQALLTWAKDLEKLKISESVAFDGLENFSYSQYDPNNVNHAVGRESLFTYDFNLSPMNRKGRMSPKQKANLSALDEEHGRYDGRAIEKDAGRIFERLLSKADGDLTLHTDNHYAYRRAIKKLNSQKLIHIITPAKLFRNFRNRLFSINHSDMLSRHHLGAFKRETIAFSKNTVSMLESFVLFAVDKNYMRPKFTKKQIRDPLANEESPAMALGLRKKIQSFAEFFGQRISIHHVKLSEDWANLFDSWDPTSRRTIRPYCGI